MHIKSIFFLGLIALYSLNAQPRQETDFAIRDWLVAGPFPALSPAFQVYSDQKKTSLETLMLETVWIDWEKLKPAEGYPVHFTDTINRWKHQIIDSAGIQFSHTGSNHYTRYLLATYLENKKWLKFKLMVSSRYVFQIYFNHQLVASKRVLDDSLKKDIGKTETEIKCETGKHLLMVHLLIPSDRHGDESFRAFIRPAEKTTDSFCLTIDPAASVSLKHILDVPRITGVQISSDGEWTLIGLSQARGDQTEQWHEIRRVVDGSLVMSTRGTSGWIQPQWAPEGKILSYMTQSNKENTIWIRNFTAQDAAPVLRNIKNVTRYYWSPDGKSLWYETTEKSETAKTGLMRTEGLRDRQPGLTDRISIYRYHLQKGFSERLTSGIPSLRTECISPSGDRVILSRTTENLEKRPYVQTSLYMLDLSTGKVDSLWSFGWLGNVEWSPDGQQLLITGGPSLFGTIGIPKALKNKIPNDYDHQAYLVNLATKKARCLTLAFNPSIDEALWNDYDGHIYFITTDRSYRHVYRYDPNRESFEFVETDVEAISGFSTARHSPWVVYYGSGAADPPKIYRYHLKNKKSELLFDPAENDFQFIRFGKVRSWSFRHKQKWLIDGYVHYPPDFDSTKTYPCIVYYYGGTTPVTRDFGGRYPKEWYAANGYIVYTLQPSGAKGYGQEFSSLHVNNWGRTVTDEIIDGVQQFLKAHPFVDRKRIACIGASYGGFMTMLLLTKTNMFTAAISHAGISSISSYWGEGFWGYTYSAMATANSFPWNRRDIYVIQSPLFSADKIQTPLLLLHGSSDNNVPVGESIQLYTALKLLNRPVELIQVEDQDHHIVQYSKRKLWTKTIMAWFDRWLKDQPEWWEDLYVKTE